MSPQELVFLPAPKVAKNFSNHMQQAKSLGLIKSSSGNAMIQIKSRDWIPHGSLSTSSLGFSVFGLPSLVRSFTEIKTEMGC